ncbi:hypothetical protein HMPREF9530_01886 [Escherichia coli MS 21-1]|nr:hypothetical protein HMPREF9530_01886 [Escherichia coli MS 21-1]
MRANAASGTNAKGNPMVPFFTSLTIAASSRQTSRFVDFLQKRRTR